MFKRLISLSVIFCFFLTTLGPMPRAHADVLGLPAPGTMVNLSPAYEPALIKGLTVHAALAAKSNIFPGGIDLNSANMAMTVTKDANGGVQVNFDPALIAQIKQKGVFSAVPVIVNVSSMSDAQLRPLLNLPQ